MAKIFLSYRRQDSAGVAGRIYDRLRAHFGNDAIFMDIDSIPFGVDFREHITAAVDQCGILLAVIGRNWAGEAGTPRRIDDPRDFVRIEIESALERNIPVVPILVDHARMPDEADLPPSLARLAYRNALDLDQGRDFHPQSTGSSKESNACPSLPIFPKYPLRVSQRNGRDCRSSSLHHSRGISQARADSAKTRTNPATAEEGVDELDRDEADPDPGRRVSDGLG